MTDKEVTFIEELPDDGRAKYPSILRDIKSASTGDNELRWAILNEFENAATAHDAAGRLRKMHEDFEFTARAQGDGSGIVYARYVGGDHG